MATRLTVVLLHLIVPTGRPAAQLVESQRERYLLQVSDFMFFTPSASNWYASSRERTTITFGREKRASPLYLLAS